MSESAIQVGIAPRFPWPFHRWNWLTEPIPAERLAALRIAVATVLLLDLLLEYLPNFDVLFTSQGVAGRDAYPWQFREGTWHWSILRALPDSWGPQLLFSVWLLAAIALLVGYRPFITGLVCWACAVSFQNINPWAHNGGDQLRNFLLLLVAVSRSGAKFGVQALPGRVLVPGWPVKLLLVQLSCVYFFSGLYKLLSPDWRSGWAMYFLNRDFAWSLHPNLTSRMPFWADLLASWGTIVGELAFPIFLFIRQTRQVALGLGVLFHLLSFLTLEIGHFALYPLASYVVFLAWEKHHDQQAHSLTLGALQKQSSSAPSISE